MDEPKVGSVIGGRFIMDTGMQAASGCHHRRGTSACGGCYARLSLAIDEAIDLLLQGADDSARLLLQETRDQRLADKAKR